jgi:hypothetical protein
MYGVSAGIESIRTVELGGLAAGKTCPGAQAFSP